MAENSGIPWCHNTHNHWIGCTKTGPGCDNCYAEVWDRRFDPEHVARHWGPGAPRRLTTVQNRNRPLRWQRDRRAAIDAGLNPAPLRVFGGSLMDPFDNEAPEGGREGLWDTIARCPDLDWILVTKRVGNVAKMAPVGGFGPNVIILSTIVNQAEADRDLPKLIALKESGIARWIGVSYEPALGFVDWGPWVQWLDWLIVGGESAQGGAEAREFRLSWAACSLTQAAEAGVPAFMKQMGSNHTYHAGRLHLRDKAGADPDEWHEAYRVRQFPTFGRAA